MTSRLAPFVAVVCLLCVVVIHQDCDKRNRPLTQTEMQRLVGGHGGTSCDLCASDTVRQDECAHFDYDDECATDFCIENWLIEDSCQLSEQSDCSSQINFSLENAIQILRDDMDCSTDNPDTWKVWRIHYYGSDCSNRTYRVRCEKETNDCSGEIIEESSRKPAIECI